MNFSWRPPFSCLICGSYVHSASVLISSSVPSPLSHASKSATDVTTQSCSADVGITCGAVEYGLTRNRGRPAASSNSLRHCEARKTRKPMPTTHEPELLQAVSTAAYRPVGSRSEELCSSSQLSAPFIRFTLAIPSLPVCNTATGVTPACCAAFARAAPKRLHSRCSLLHCDRPGPFRIRLCHHLRRHSLLN